MTYESRGKKDAEWQAILAKTNRNYTHSETGISHDTASHGAASITEEEEAEAEETTKIKYTLANTLTPRRIS